MKIKSFAKINLGIEVLRKREDGYHDIRTLFQTVSLYDVLEFKPAGHGRVELRGDDDRIPWDERNLIHKAASCLRERFNFRQGVEIRVTKNIPPGSGLGGGSSNAAATLIALNRMWGLRLSRKKLREVAGHLGADVSFFLVGGLCLGEGRGEVITPLPDPAPLPCVLILPPFPILTAEIYGRLLAPLTSEREESKIKQFLVRKNFSLLENGLETTIISLYPRMGDYLGLVPREESLLSLVSGAGSAVFGLFDDRGKAAKAYEKARQATRACFVETVPRGRYRKQLVAGV